MKLRANFEDGECVVSLIPTDDWEKTLLGVIAKGNDKIHAVCTYKTEGHFSYGKAGLVQIHLSSIGDVPDK